MLVRANMMVVVGGIMKLRSIESRVYVLVNTLVNNKHYDNASNLGVRGILAHGILTQQKPLKHFGSFTLNGFIPPP